MATTITANVVNGTTITSNVSSGNTITANITTGGLGDMNASVYDPTSVGGDAFDTDNHASGTTNKVYTATEQTKLAGVSPIFTVGSTDATYLLSNYSNNVGAALTAAIAAANAAGGGTVLLREGSYTLTTRVAPLSNVTVRGEGMGVTTITGSVASDYQFYTNGTIEHFWIEDMTLDANNVAAAGCVRLNRATDCGLRRVEMLNVTNSWQTVIGVNDGATDGVLNERITIEDCIFDGHIGSLEELLVFNAKDVSIIRPTFKNVASGTAIGLWQKTYNVNIVEPVFRDFAGKGIYYSITCHNTNIERPYFENIGSAIYGANISDNGQFGEDQAQGLRIINPVIIGGANSTSDTGIQLGAVNHVLVQSPLITGYQVGMLFHNGNGAATFAATNWTVLEPHIYNNNPDNDVHVYHSGIFFQSVGGSQYGKIIGGAIYDDQGTQTQRYPISFSGAFTWSDIEIIGTRLSADTGNSGTSLRLNDSAALGSTFRVTNAQDYSGSAATNHIVGDKMTELVDDTTPQLGGNLDLNSNDITGTGDITLTGGLSTTSDAGFGTTSPVARTEMVGTASGAEVFAVQVRNNATATGTTSTIRFKNSTAATTGDDSGAGQISLERTNSPVSGDVEMSFELKGTERLRIGARGDLWITDGITAPSASTGVAKLYIDSADGDLKIVFADGTVKTIVTDS